MQDIVLYENEIKSKIIPEAKAFAEKIFTKKPRKRYNILA